MKLGGDRDARLTAKARAAGRAAVQERARNRALDLAPTIQELRAAGCESLRAIAAGLPAGVASAFVWHEGNGRDASSKLTFMFGCQAVHTADQRLFKQDGKSRLLRNGVRTPAGGRHFRSYLKPTCEAAASRWKRQD